MDKTMTQRLARKVIIEANAATSRSKSVITLSLSFMFLICSFFVPSSISRTFAERF
jgi:hypothetical protein